MQHKEAYKPHNWEKLNAHFKSLSWRKKEKSRTHTDAMNTARPKESLQWKKKKQALRT